MKTKRVRDFMAKHYTTVSPEQSLATAVRTLLEYHQSAAPVVNAKQELVGLLSEADCMRTTLLEGYFNEGVALVKDQMTAATETVSPDEELSSVSEMFLKHCRRMMPVVEAGVLVGIVSRKDILKALIN
ncbi:MAG TPA: CBS domain-containing protein [Cellvibrionales bacterium]|jgi:CBS domain-containing protein|nr:CBS domain-containing protein [Cellvibrionales bacterium]HAW14263.1 CBS domain-containing protein [Cellvibrionales bacterium]HCX26395.1 CBS domain-containing protein [Cellvibrionales bacterium]